MAPTMDRKKRKGKAGLGAEPEHMYRGMQESKKYGTYEHLFSEKP